MLCQPSQRGLDLRCRRKWSFIRIEGQSNWRSLVAQLCTAWGMGCFKHQRWISIARPSTLLSEELSCTEIWYITCIVLSKNSRSNSPETFVSRILLKMFSWYFIWANTLHINIPRMKNSMSRIGKIGKNLNAALPHLEEGRWSPVPTSNNPVTFGISRVGG